MTSQLGPSVSHSKHAFWALSLYLCEGSWVSVTKATVNLWEGGRHVRVSISFIFRPLFSVNHQPFTLISLQIYIHVNIHMYTNRHTHKHTKSLSMQQWLYVSCDPYVASIYWVINRKSEFPFDISQHKREDRKDTECESAREIHWKRYRFRPWERGSGHSETKCHICVLAENLTLLPLLTTDFVAACRKQNNKIRQEIKKNCLIRQALQSIK